MSNVNSLPPIGGEDPRDAEALAETETTTDAAGERALDPDANDDLVDSAEADRLAAGEGREV